MDISELLQKVDIQILAERAGARFGKNGSGNRSHCPIHNGDNETAFHIYQDDQEKWHWHCHTNTRCGGGDALDLFMKWRGFSDYRAAAEELAKEFNIPFSWGNDPEAAEREQKRRSRAEILDMATSYFQEQLWHPSACRAMEYLYSRGFTNETITQLRFGYSNSGPGLFKYLFGRQANMDVAFETGVVNAARYDFTANSGGRAVAPHGWIVIPYRINHRTVYFSSRAIEVPGEPRPDPKDKSRNLVGEAPAYRAEVKGVESVVLVEGLLDAASLYQMGQTAWAMAGVSGLHKPDVEAIKRRKTVYLSTDSDDAGQEPLKTTRSALSEMCKEIGPLTMIVAPLEGVKDWNDILKDLDPVKTEAMRRAFDGAVTWLDYRMGQACNCPVSEREFRYEEIGKLLANVPSASRTIYYQSAQKVLHMTKQDVKALVANAIGKHNNRFNSEIRDGQLYFLDEPMGNFWAKVSRELLVDNGQDQPDVRLEIEGGLDDGTELPTIEIDASEFNQLNWVTRRWGATPTFYVARKDYYKLIRAIQEISQDDLIRERQYAYTGWAKVDGAWSYLMSNGRITANGLDNQIRVDLGDPNLTRYELPNPPTEPGRAVDAVRASLDYLKAGKRRVTAIIWAAMYAAPLTSEIPLYAMLWIYGQTQTGKSIITMLGLTHFGKSFVDGHNYHAPAEWISSFAGLEDIAFTLKDTTLVIDDYAPRFSSKAEATEQSKTAQLLIRTVGNRSAKRRSRNYEKSPRPPRAMLIATAENPLIGQSTVGRVIYVPVNKGDVINTGEKNQQLNTAQQQAQSGLYAEAMALYVQWLAAHWDDLKGSLGNRVVQVQEEMSKAHPDIQPRLPGYYGVLAVAQELALEAFVDMKKITQDEADKISKENRDAIEQVIVQQSVNISAESPVRKVFMAINSALERGRGYLAPRINGEKFNPPERSELIGWYEPGNHNEVWFNTLTILELAKAFWTELDENLDIREDILKQQLESSGVIHRGDGNHLDTRVLVNGRLGRYLEVDVNMVETLFDIQLLRKPLQEKK